MLQRWVGLRQVCDTVGEIGQHVLGTHPWPELLSAMFTWGTVASPPRLRSASFSLFQGLALYVGSELVPQFAAFVDLFDQTLKDTHCPNKVRPRHVLVARVVVILRVMAGWWFVSCFPRGVAPLTCCDSSCVWDACGDDAVLRHASVRFGWRASVPCLPS